MKAFITVVALALSLQTLLPGQSINDSIITAAMRDEIKRNMQQLSYKDQGAPCFIGFMIQDVKTIAVSATLGAIISAEDDRFRSWADRVLAGSYKVNDENYYNETNQQKKSNEYLDLPLDDDYMGIRRSMWLSINNVYKSAVENYKSKIETLHDKKFSVDSLQIDDFSNAPAIKLTIPDQPLQWNIEQVKQLARETSVLFKQYPDFTSSGVYILQLYGVLYYMNSEGTETRVPFPITLMHVWASTETNDGELISDQLSYIVHDISQLQEISKIKNDIVLLADNIKNKKQAVPLDDNYEGPVLVMGQPVADIFKNCLFAEENTLIAYREPLNSNSSMPVFYAENRNTFEAKMNKQVISKNLTVKTFSHLKQYNGIPLLGSFDVDAEGVIPPDSLVLIENGILKNLLNGRTPTRTMKQSNGHNRFVLHGSGISYDIAPGNVMISTDKGQSYEALKKALLKQAQEEGLEYAMIIKPVKQTYYAMPVNVYKVWVSDGREELIRSFSAGIVDDNTLKKLTSISHSNMVCNFMFSNYNKPDITSSFGPLSGAPVSFIFPDAILLDAFEINKTPRSLVTEKPVVKNPLQ